VEDYNGLTLVPATAVRFTGHDVHPLPVIGVAAPRESVGAPERAAPVVGGGLDSCGCPKGRVYRAYKAYHGTSAGCSVSSVYSPLSETPAETPTMAAIMAAIVA
jgi:hypothetical protein